MKYSTILSRNFECVYHQSSKRYFFLILVAMILIYVIYITEQDNTRFLQKEQISSIIKQELTYLINTSQCRIPESDPYSEDIVNFIKEEKYFKCSQKGLLTYINKSDGIVTLNVNKSVLSEYSQLDIKCCYSNITRINYEKLVDNQIKLTDCTAFQDSVELTFPYIKVICSTFFGEIYANVHATTLPLDSEASTSSKDQKFSILLLGIDSMSKSNLIRTMPKTSSYAEKNMINLRGYNKVDDNTIPNFLAMFTGYSTGQAQSFCNISVKQNFCRFIWDTFQNLGYVTAYAEDECQLNTFNYDRLGFSDQPTDYYYHPYFIAAEQLPVVMREKMTYCAGPETSGERILNAAKDFAVTFKNVPYFGLFWSNSYSHDNVNMPGVMDEPVLNLLSDPEFIASLDNTLLLFFSDHGFRFGDIRYTHTGWLEERLPFIFLRIPEKFKHIYPEHYNNLLTNSNRLTSNWDVFNTFQEILSLQNETYTPRWSHGCPKCRSLFVEIPENRTCEDASIAQHWCTCKGHNYINPEHPRVKSVSQFAVSEINNLIKSFNEGSLCSEYTVRKIKTAGVSELYLNKKYELVQYFLVMVETNPPAIFEATVESIIDKETNNFRLLGDVSRVDRYDAVTTCIKNNGFLKKHCYCASFFCKIWKFIWKCT